MLRGAKIVRLLQAPTEDRRPVKWRIFDEAPVRELIAALRIASERPSQTETTRMILVELLGKRRVRSAVPVLLECLDDPSEKVQLEVMQALGRIGAPEVGEVLYRRFNFAEETKWMRFELLANYGEAGFKPAIPLLITTLSDEDKDLRRVAAGSLWCLQAKEAIVSLEHAVTVEPDSYTKQWMSECLAKLKADEEPSYSRWQQQQLVNQRVPRNASGSRQRPYIVRWRLYD